MLHCIVKCNLFVSDVISLKLYVQKCHKGTPRGFHSSDDQESETRSGAFSGYKMNAKFYWKNDYFVLLLFFKLIYNPPSSSILKTEP